MPQQKWRWKRLQGVLIYSCFKERHGKLISNANKGGLLTIDSLIPTGEDEDGNVQWKTTREVLREKHPQGRAPVAEILLPEPEINETQTMPPLLFILQKCLGGFM